MRCDRCLKYIRSNGKGEYVDIVYGSLYCEAWTFPRSTQATPMHISKDAYIKALTPEFGQPDSIRLWYALRILQSAAEVIYESADPEALKTEAVKHARAMLRTYPRKAN